MRLNWRLGCWGFDRVPVGDALPRHRGQPSPLLIGGGLEANRPRLLIFKLGQNTRRYGILRVSRKSLNFGDCTLQQLGHGRHPSRGGDV